MKVLNFGSLNIDYVYSVEHMVEAGETLASSGMKVFSGGKGMNQSIALAKAGVPVFHAGMVGEEGQILLDTCQEAGVDVTYVQTIQGKTGHTIIQVDRSGLNCILLYGGANQSITREFVDHVLADFGPGDFILLQNEINELDYIISQAHLREMTIVLNPSPFNQAVERCDLSKVSLFLLNEIEGGQITGREKPGEILDAFRAIYPQAKVVLTLGQDGAWYQDGLERYHQGIFPVQVKDTTAAGDTFTGYFIAGLIEDRDIRECLRRAARASSIAVSRQGAAPSIPRKEEVDQAEEDQKS